jgi:xanthine dehydrogenase YagR molybdenum-binding subunit
MSDLTPRFFATGKRLRSTPITPDKVLLGDREIPVAEPPQAK